MPNRDPKEPPYRWVGPVVSVIVIVATYFYHVHWWTEFAP